jgi:hypothetical protein
VRKLSTVGEILALDMPGLGVRIERDGAVVVFDLSRAATAIAAPVFASPRATRSSRTPGQVNRGTIYTPAAELETCGHCGRVRRVFPGVHSPQVGPEGAIDCVGRPVERDDAGFYQPRVAP